MLKELYSNAATTTLSGGINNSVTTVNVANSSSWPSANFRVKVDSEIMFVTANASNTLTVVRGVEGTTAASHSSGANIDHIITAGALDAIKADLYAVMGHGRIPTSGNTYGDEFDDENFSGWTAVNSGSAPLGVVTEQDKMASVLIPSGGAAAQLNAWMKDTGGSLSSGNYIQACMRFAYNSDQYPMPMLIMADGVTYNSGKQACMAYSSRELTYALKYFTGYNAQVSDISGTTGYLVNANNDHIIKDMHMRLVYKGSNQFDTYWSSDGVSFVKMHSNATPSGLTITPRYIGFAATTWGSSTCSALLSIRNFRTNF